MDQEDFDKNFMEHTNSFWNIEQKSWTKLLVVSLNGIQSSKGSSGALYSHILIFNSKNPIVGTALLAKVHEFILT